MLDFPSDPRNALAGFVRSLEYDASFAIIAEQVQPALQNMDLKGVPPLRFGSDDHIPAIKQEFAGLGARFAFISMITRFEGYLWRLLHHRYVVEAIAKHPNELIRGPEYLKIRKMVRRETRKGIATVLGTEVVRKPSADLKNTLPWLEGLIRVRNCLMHRGGVVQLEDTEPENELTIPWVDTRMLLNGQEIKLPHIGGGHLIVKPEMTTRTWKVGQVIHFSATELQDVAFALARVAQGVEREFEVEILPLAKELAGNQS